MTGSTVIRVSIALTAGDIAKIANLIVIVLILPVGTSVETEVCVVSHIEARVTGSALRIQTAVARITLESTVIA